MHIFEVHSNESTCRKIGCLGMEQVLNAAPLAPPGTKVLIHDNLEKRALWAPHIIIA